MASAGRWWWWLQVAVAAVSSGLASGKLASHPVIPDNGIANVHVVFMNHLDVGYTNNIASVMNMYWHTYFPTAIATAARLNVPGADPVFRYTSHAWLLDLFFDCPDQLGLHCNANASGITPGTRSTRPPGRRAAGLGVTPDDHPGCVVCPTAAEVAAVSRAVRDGVITYHAFPFNAEPELADAELIKGGIAAVHALDSRFGQPKKTVMSQRDVPGVTRGIVPILAGAGVLAFSEGANAQIVPPEVPGSIFNWTDTASGTSILMLLHPRGYGVSFDEETGERFGHENPCPTATDMVYIPGFDEALIYAFKDDNKGPHNVTEAQHVMDCVRSLIPGGGGGKPRVFGSTFDAFVAAVMASPTARAALPVVTQEIGDTWIFGAQADPRKTKALRIMMRQRTACLRAPAAARCNASDPAFTNFTRFLLKPTEHTFGLHSLADKQHWSNAQLHLALVANTPTGAAFRQWEASWLEQRLYTDYALQALQASSDPANRRLVKGIVDAMAAAAPGPSPPDLTGFSQLTAAELKSSLQSQHFEFRVNVATGGLASLVTRADGVEWATSPPPARTARDAPAPDLFQYVYRTNNQVDDFTPFRHNFTGDWKNFPGSWFTKQPGGCYDKTNLDNATCRLPMGCAKSRDWLPASVKVFARSDGGASSSNHRGDAGGLAMASITELVVALQPPAEAHTKYGAPADVWIRMSFADGSASIGVDLQWASKTATRLPEATLLAMPLAACASASAGAGTDAPGTAGSPSTAWAVDKLGSWVDTSDIVPNGGAGHLHAVGDGGARRRCGGTTVNAVGLDTALWSIGRNTAFPTPLTPQTEAEAAAGIFAVLHNNYWDTNYPYWYPFGDDAVADSADRFRFTVSWSDASSSSSSS